MAEIYRIYLLRPGSVPHRHEALDNVREVEKHRFLACQCYNDCLHFVARSPWKGFTCARCPRFLEQTA